jgi:uncharacterized protein
MEKINIEFSGNKIEAVLNDTDTARKILESLPVEGSASRWGYEIYFSIPVEADLENGTAALEKGDLAFWPPGKAFCIFFGPTPASIDDRPKPAGPVTVIGKIINIKDIRVLRLASDGQPISISRIL